MINKHMKKYSTSVVIRKLQIKTTMRYYHTPIGKARIKKTFYTKCWSVGKDVELSYTTDGNLRWYTPCGNGLAVSLKIKHTPAAWSRYFASRYLSKRKESLCSYKDCTKRLIISLFVIAQSRNNPSTNQQISYKPKCISTLLSNRKAWNNRYYNMNKCQNNYDE